MALQIGLQLYSVREEAERDFIGALEQVRSIGYDGVEFAGFGGFSAKELKEELDRIGLIPMSAHIPFSQLKDQMGESVAYSAELGLGWAICPGHPLATRDDIAEVSATLTALSKALEPYGIKTGYHNHSHEFRNRIDGRAALDLLIEATEGEAVFFEIDTCWAGYADVDPLPYIDALKGRAGPLHFKDLNPDYRDMKPHDIDAEVGTGIIDFSGLLKIMEKNHILENGVIVEQEGSKTDIWNSVAICCQNIRKMEK